MIMKETTENWIEAFLQYAQMKRWSINTISTYSTASELPTHAIGDGMGFGSHHSYQRRQFVPSFSLSS